MTTIDQVKKAMDDLIENDHVIQLKSDPLFLGSVAQLYDEYLVESDGVPNWDLETYVADKVEWLEQQKRGR